MLKYNYWSVFIRHNKLKVIVSVISKLILDCAKTVFDEKLQEKYLWIFILCDVPIFVMRIFIINRVLRIIFSFYS